MEYILNSHYHKVCDNCLRFNFKQPIFFNNQKYPSCHLNIIIILKILQMNLIWL